jgi:hypothetical protein
VRIGAAKARKETWQMNETMGNGGDKWFRLGGWSWHLLEADVQASC